MNKPTDAELTAIYKAANGESTGKSQPLTTQRIFRAMRAAIAQWGSQPAVAAEPVAWLSTDRIGERYLCFTKPKDSDAARPLVFGDSTQQPAQAQAGALESAEFDRFLSDVLTAAGLVTHGKQCKALGERLADMCATLRRHGIKGGQHGTE